MSGYWNSCIDCQRHMFWFGDGACTRRLRAGSAARCSDQAVPCCSPRSCVGPWPTTYGIRRRAERRVFDQRAVAVAVAAVAGLHEPVEAPGRVALVGRLLDQLLHRDRAVRAGRVVVEVAGHVLALRLGGESAAGDDAHCGRSERCDDGSRHLALRIRISHRTHSPDGHGYNKGHRSTATNANMT